MSARHEPTLGILMLEGKMANVTGLMAGDDTFPYRTVRHVVTGARTPRTPDDAIAMLPLYKEAAKHLSEGVDVITANCGLIALLQQELADAVDVPVVTSSLVSVPTVARLIGPRRRVGILTFFRDAVGERNYVASGWSSSTVPVSVAGVDGSESWLEFLETKEVPPDLRRRLGADLRAAIDELLEREPTIGALVSECTMLPAVLDDIREDVPVPIFDLPTTLDWALSGYRRAASAQV